MAALERLEVGHHVVWKGQGLARVTGFGPRNGEDVVELTLADLGGTRLSVPRRSIHRAVLPLVDRATAARLREVLSTPGEADPRSLEALYVDAMRTLTRGHREAQAFRLRTLYASPFSPSFGERKLIELFEQVLLTELAHVLERPVAELRAEVRAPHAVFAPTAPPRPPGPERPPEPPQGPVVPGHALVGRFQVDSGLVVADPLFISSLGDAPEGKNCRLRALAGPWYGYTVEVEDGTGVLLAAHASKVEVKPSFFRRNPLAALEARATRAGLVEVQSGQLAILDQSVRNEQRVSDELLFRTIHGIVLGRGCTSGSCSGDGVYPVSTVEEAGQAVFVLVDFRGR